ncbi:hypothetical protein FB567DRAFT_321311 [Paraphoma chrysanthemicola]|uniref:F-box domain-containing protein n=1 Tax=Paraphoma chrysanthemicola TaxID=798071 RepID=A0A8K0VZN4_9PLEO|nr:hypothetical protein FB567DRAFT_321311 [Paraphoma chrysanthemicola]
MISKTIFRRSDSSGSSKSRTSTSESTSDGEASRTSIESNHYPDLAITEVEGPEPQSAPILTLPIELLQHIAAYLDTASAAPFSLSSRYIYYALGSTHLSTHINSTKSRFEKRATISALVERAFPDHWFCAWCDKFHAWNPTTTSPTNPSDGQGRDCTDFNSYLTTSTSKDTGAYILRYHHIRLALAHHTHGPAHGIPLSTFSHSTTSMPKLHRTPIPAHLTISAKIVHGRFILHATHALIIPAHLSTNRNILTYLSPLLPSILVAHRASEHGHTNLLAALDNVLRRGWKYPDTQTCADCNTDWSIQVHFFGHRSGGQVRLVLRAWRDLGNGGSPFEQMWRGHACWMRGVDRASAGHARWGTLGDGGIAAGEIRRAFECVDDGAGYVGMKQRSASPLRMRIYQSFMARRGRDGGAGDEVGYGDGEIRRSRARPRTWRTRSENEEAERRQEEERVEIARQVAEELVRMDAMRGRVGSRGW